MCQVDEQINKQTLSMTRQPLEDVVHKINSRKIHREPNLKRECGRCGHYDHHEDSKNCPARNSTSSTAKIAMKANAAKAILDEPTAATEAYRKSVAQGIYCIHGARLWRMKHQAAVPFSLIAFKIENIWEFIEEATGGVGQQLTGSRGSNIFEAKSEATISLNLKARDGDNYLKPRLMATVSRLPASLATDWVASKTAALGFTPLSVTNVVGNILALPTKKCEVELQFQEKNW
ncbi:hypothetical protein ACLKA6_010168 [Drosophila palustris]